MDDSAARKAMFRLIRDAMPRVMGLVDEKRKERGDEFVRTCQAKSLAGEPGWFYACEGPLAIGTPWLDAWEAVHFAAQVTERPGFPPGAAMVVWRKELPDGT